MNAAAVAAVAAAQAEMIRDPMRRGLPSEALWWMKNTSVLSHSADSTIIAAARREAAAFLRLKAKREAAAAGTAAAANP